MLAKILLVVTIVLQLVVAITQQGWLRSVSELSAFLLVATLAYLFQIKAGELKAKQETSKIL
ncbi:MULTISPECIES: hypothetical protein [Vibrio]|uniref:O-succinylbenzoic acid--CoA ligase n=2 Tax=Vibrio TaxID=662 RepID=A0A7X4RTG1_9VIBR|nr:MULTISPECIES: hypothetical protein [Vibrio]MBF8999649.1 hypothetical protein [Vibrio nitrifigilis]MZI92215.1 hypothetical protein [Vibrio eleionomae]